MHWSFGLHPHHPHGGLHHWMPPHVHVGRIGALAVALGIGVASATGFCATCAARAYGDTGDPTGPDASTSQSIAPVSRPAPRGTRAAATQVVSTAPARAGSAAATQVGGAASAMQTGSS